MANQPMDQMGTDGSAMVGQIQVPDRFPRGGQKALSLAEFAEQYRGLKPGVKIRLADVAGVFQQYAQYRALDRQLNNRLQVEDQRFLHELQRDALRQLGSQDSYGIDRLDKVYRIWESLQKRIEAIRNSDSSNAEKQDQIDNITQSNLYRQVVAFLMGQGIAALSQVNQQQRTGDPDRPLPFRDPSALAMEHAGLGAGPTNGVARLPSAGASATPLPPGRGAGLGTVNPAAVAATGSARLAPLPLPAGASSADQVATGGVGTPAMARPAPTMMSLGQAASGVIPAAGSRGAAPIYAPPTAPTAPTPTASPLPRLQAAAPAAQQPAAAPVEEYRYNPKTGEIARRDPITGRIEIVGRIPVRR